MQEFTNEQIDLAKLPKYQEIELSKPHPDYWKVIILNLIFFSLLLAAGLTALVVLDENLRSNLSVIIGSYVALISLLFIIYRASFKKRGYALREKDIVYKSGIIAEKTTIVPLNRIQHVALDEAVFSRIFKLGKLQIYTAGGQSGHLHIGGIPIEKAKNIKEVLLRRLDQIENLAENQS